MQTLVLSDDELVEYLGNVYAAAMGLNMIVRGKTTITGDQLIRGVNHLKTKKAKKEKERQVEQSQESDSQPQSDDDDGTVIDMEAPSATEAISKAKQLAAAQSLLRLQTREEESVDGDEAATDSQSSDPSYRPSGTKKSKPSSGKRGWFLFASGHKPSTNCHQTPPGFVDWKICL